MSFLEIYLGGEGPNELGSRAGDPVYQTDDNPGVIQALLLKVQTEGWCVVGATTWSKIRKFRANGPSLNEERNVLGLIEAAWRAEADAVAFIRDSDGDADRSRVVAEAIEKGGRIFSTIDIIGGTAIPVLEGWILAICGVHDTERMSKAKAQSRLTAQGIAVKNTLAMVDAVKAMNPDTLPQDAVSLKRWLASARRILAR
jgi:hypothetical protein